MNVYGTLGRHPPIYTARDDLLVPDGPWTSTCPSRRSQFLRRPRKSSPAAFSKPRGSTISLLTDDDILNGIYRSVLPYQPGCERDLPYCGGGGHLRWVLPHDARRHSAIIVCTGTHLALLNVYCLYKATFDGSFRTTHGAIAPSSIAPVLILRC